MSDSEPIAIIGMSCLFPMAPDVDAFWRNIVGKVDAVTDPPPESWDPESYYDPDSTDPDRIYCKRGGFLGNLARFDPIANNVPPNSVGGEPDQWLALQLARDALIDAGYPEPEESIRRKTGVILGRGATFNGGTAISVQHSLVITQTLKILKALHPEYDDAQIEALRVGLRSNLPAMGSEIVPGLVPNIVAGRISNRLDLMGPSYTIDAACASSVVAVQNGVRDLATGDCDMVLAGGAQVWTPMPMLSVFCQLNALSHRQQIRPFDKDADGTILGEGVGVIVLKRLKDAERDGDRVYAVITGVAVASDGRGLGVMAPRLEGEELAIRRAYEAAGVSPDTIGLIEAHGTGTAVGDLTEIQALARVFGPRSGRLPSVALGTVKSMISHTVPAAGVAGIIKAALALHFKVIPPTLHCDEPNPRFELDKTPFYISTETRPWISGGPEPRRAGVSAFGFGGVDSHVVLEEYLPAEERALARNGFDPALAAHRPPWDSEVLVLQAPTRSELIGRLKVLEGFVAAMEESSPVTLEDLAYTLAADLGSTGVQPVRAAVVAASTPDLRLKLARVLERLSDPSCSRIQDRSGIYFYSEPLAATGKLAFLFPGEGSQYANMLADLCMHFPEVRRTFDAIDRVYREGGRDYVPSDFVYPRPTFAADEKGWVESQLWDMDVAPAAVLTANEALSKLLGGLGLKPDVVLGHSSGEWSALRAAGVFGTSTEDRDRWIAAELLDVYRETIDLDDIPRASLLAIGADRTLVAEIVAEVGGGVGIAMDNCPHQVVVAVTPEAAPRVAEAARKRSLVVEALEFDRPYHTPLFAPYSKRLASALEPLEFGKPRIPVISCATGRPFPADASSIKSLACDQWVKPVRFRQTVEDLYDRRGVRIFVEVGPRGNLAAFVEDILRGKRACIVPADQLRRSGTAQLNHLAGILSAHGLDLDLEYLYRWRTPRRVDLEAAPDVRKAPAALLKTQFPEMKVPESLAAELRTEKPPAAAAPQPAAMPPAPPAPVAPLAATAQTTAHDGDQLAHSFLETMEQFLGVQERVMSAYLTGAPSGRPYAPAPPAPRSAPPSNGRVGAGDNGSTSTPAVVFPQHTPMEEPIVPEAQAVPPEPVEEPPLPEPEKVPPGADYETVLREIVSERTGYPIETIALTADLEADLGIDSIKRVEIMGTFRQRLSGDPAVEIEDLTAQRTLQGVIDVARG
jgi:acyl transferase domain-containing protein/acyl carrier protein